MRNELDIKTNNLLQEKFNAKYLAITPEINLSMEKATKIPLSKVSALGVAFEPLTQIAQTITSGSGKSGIYYVNTKGMQMFSKNGDTGFIGALKNSNGSVGGGQATMTQMPCNPTMLFMAAVLMSVEKKLDDIHEIQEDILLYLEQKDKTKLQSDLNVLTDILNNYKYNFNNEKYKTNKHIQVQEIKRNAEHSMLLYREQIGSKIRKRRLLHSDQEANAILEKLKTQFKDYQLALYLYSFSSFAEVMLLENFDAGYLDSVTGRIDEHSFQYRKLYTDCYDLMENYCKSSVQSNLLKCLSKASKSVGNTIAKMPVISNFQLDESLIESSEKLKAYLDSKPDKPMQKLIDAHDNVSMPFIENLKTVNMLYNGETKYYIDKENIYFLPCAE